MAKNHYYSVYKAFGLSGTVQGMFLVSAFLAHCGVNASCQKTAVNGRHSTPTHLSTSPKYYILPSKFTHLHCLILPVPLLSRWAVVMLSGPDNFAQRSLSRSIPPRDQQLSHMQHLRFLQNAIYSSL